MGHPQPRRATTGATARRERHAHRAGLRLCRAVPHLRGGAVRLPRRQRGLRAEPDGDTRARWASSAGSAIRRRCPSCRRRAPGFGIYVAGDIFTIELEGGALPAAGTVWTLRAGAWARSPAARERVETRDRMPTATPKASCRSRSIGAELRSQLHGEQPRWRPPARTTSAKSTRCPTPTTCRARTRSSTDQKVLKFVGLPRESHHPDLLLERHPGTGAGAQLHPAWRIGRGASLGPRRGDTGTCGTGTTRWWPVGCTSITLNRGGPGGSAASPS